MPPYSRCSVLSIEKTENKYRLLPPQTNTLRDKRGSGAWGNNTFSCFSPIYSLKQPTYFLIQLACVNWGQQAVHHLIWVGRRTISDLSLRIENVMINVNNNNNKLRNSCQRYTIIEDWKANFVVKRKLVKNGKNCAQQELIVVMKRQKLALSICYPVYVVSRDFPRWNNRFSFWMHWARHVKWGITGREDFSCYMTKPHAGGVRKCAST